MEGVKISDCHMTEEYKTKTTQQFVANPFSLDVLMITSLGGITNVLLSGPVDVRSAVPWKGKFGDKGTWPAP
jgi:hypothetical protein